MDNLLDAIIAAKLAGGGGGGGGDVTPASIVTATGLMDDTQKGQTRSNLDAAAAANPEVRGAIGITGYGDPPDKIYAMLDNPAADRPPILVLADDATDDPIIVRGIDDPIYTTDAANKNYVDQLKPTTVTVSGTTPTITPVANTIYNCGTLDSLTITNPPETGAYSIVFTSGSTATTTTIPITILGLESFAAEASTLYEINVLDNRAVIGSWAVSA